MGTVNYSTSEYITLGVKPYCAYDLERDADFMDEARERVEMYGGTLEDFIYQWIEYQYQADRANVKAILERYAFVYFHVSIEPGYYEGFTLDIEPNYGICYDTWKDKRAAQRELTRLQACLLECAGVGLVECWPGWCTGYASYTETCEGIRKAIKRMREGVRSTLTWSRYERSKRGCV